MDTGVVQTFVNVNSTGGSREPSGAAAIKLICGVGADSVIATFFLITEDTVSTGHAVLGLEDEPVLGGHIDQLRVGEVWEEDVGHPQLAQTSAEMVGEKTVLTAGSDDDLGVLDIGIKIVEYAFSFQQLLVILIVKYSKKTSLDCLDDGCMPSSIIQMMTKGKVLYFSTATSDNDFKTSIIYVKINPVLTISILLDKLHHSSIGLGSELQTN